MITSFSLFIGSIYVPQFLERFSKYHKSYESVQEEKKEQVEEVILKFKNNVLEYGNEWDLGCEILDIDCTSIIGTLFKSEYALAVNESIEEAVSFFQQALLLRSYKNSTTVEEELSIQAYSAWLLNGDLNKAGEVFFDLASIPPYDLFALKRAQLMFFLIGEMERLLEITLQLKDKMEGRPYYHAMLSFAYEQVGVMDEALTQVMLIYNDLFMMLF